MPVPQQNKWYLVNGQALHIRHRGCDGNIIEVALHHHISTVVFETYHLILRLLRFPIIRLAFERKRSTASIIDLNTHIQT
jgi:hypothetical protein